MTIQRRIHLSKLRYFTSKWNQPRGRTDLLSTPLQYSGRQRRRRRGEVSHFEAAGVLGGRMPETQPLVQCTAAALAPGVCRRRWRSGEEVDAKV
nr:unnamed protein product [Digitaria exilis]